MSHLTKSKVDIRDLNILLSAAKKLGLKVQKGDNLTYRSHYVTSSGCSAILTTQDGRGQAGVKKVAGQDTYEMVLDNYNNPLIKVAGRDCALLGREYTAEMVRQQSMLMGGVISNEEILQDGSIVITTSI